MRISVCIITYNQEKYIAQAIEGALFQQTNFDYELVVGEDCSTDCTKEIILSYQSRHPEKIRLLTTEQNLGMMENFTRAIEACQGQYIALCEGDDYWTDPCKLQKQVDFLDSNPEYSMCFHKSVTANEINPDEGGFVYPAFTEDSDLTLEDILTSNPAFTASVVFKKKYLEPLPNWFQNSPFGDWAVYLLVSRFGKIRYLNECMSVYRIHTGGVHSSQTYSDSGEIKNLKKHIKFNKLISRHILGNMPHKDLNRQLVDMLFRLYELRKRQKSYTNMLAINTQLIPLKERPPLRLLVKNYFRIVLMIFNNGNNA